MKKFLRTSAAVLLLAFAAGACSDDEILDTMSISLEKESYTVAPLEKLEIPFTVKNAGGSLAVTVVPSETGYGFSALMSGRNTGSILFVAPDVNTEAKTLALTLTVTSADGKRTASAPLKVTISTSNELSVAFGQSAYNLLAEAGDVVTLSYEIEEQGYATIDKVEVNASNGWTPKIADDGYIELTVPADSKSTSVSLTVTDNFGRSASAGTAVSLKEVVTLTERANCHLVAPGSLIRFDASHRGNSDEASDMLESVSAELLWQDVKGLINEVSFDAKTKTILVSVANLSGNAVVATRDAQGEINWSWHIWAADYNPKADALQVQNDVNAKMKWVYMNRDLGATTDDWKTMDFMGLYYQWGRKDPFPRLASHETFEARPVYDMDGNETRIDYAFVQTTDNLKNAIQNPMTFYGNENNNVGDWYTTTLTTHNNALWGGSDDTHHKTIYDPCPAGWRIPENDYLSTGLQSILTYCGYFTQMVEAVDAEKYAKDYYVAQFSVSGYNWYFPYAGRMSSQNGEINVADSFACYWTANHYKTASSYGAYYFTFNTFIGTGGKANTYEKRACGHSVRCVLDDSAR